MQYDAINWLLNVVVYGVPAYIFVALPLTFFLTRGRNDK